MTTLIGIPTIAGLAEDRPYLITSDIFERMIEREVFPPDSRVFLWDGRLCEKMAKSLPHAGVQGAFTMELVPRLPRGFFLSPENPIRLDATHLPLPDLIAARGSPLDLHRTRYPDGRDVVLVVEVAVTSLADDLGPRLARYASPLPSATYVVADVANRRILVHTEPQADGTYRHRTVVGPGEALRIALDGIDLEPIPYESVMP